MTGGFCCCFFTVVDCAVSKLRYYHHCIVIACSDMYIIDVAVVVSPLPLKIWSELELLKTVYINRETLCINMKI